MRKYALAVALVALAVPSVRAAFYETERVSQTLKMDPGGTLRLRSFSGHVTITASDRPEIVIDAVRSGTRTQLDHIKLDIHADGSSVVVDANRHERSWYDFVSRNSVVETDFDVKVPRRTNLDLSVFSAPVTVDGIEGSHKLHSFSSRLSLSDVSGSIQAHTFSGPVLIRQKSWDAGETIDVHTFSGNVELHVPESASGAVTFKTFSGRLNSEMPLTLRNSRRRNLEAELGGGGNSRLRFETFSGSVKIDR